MSATSALERETEFRRCARDFVYFLQRYWQIARPRQKPAVIELWPAQHKIAGVYTDDALENVITLKARQIGWTTLTTAYFFHASYFEEYTPNLFVSQNQEYAVKNLNMAKFGYARLPKWMRDRGPQVTASTTEVFALENGSSIQSIPATASAGRGDAVWGVMWDEVAQAPAPEDMWAALEPLCYGKFFLLSTAAGMGNFFHRTWIDSEMSDSSWKGLFFPWSANPTRDEEWYEAQAKKHRGQLWVLHQEYPRNPQEAFAKSGRNAIGYDLLEEFEWEEPKWRYAWDAASKQFDWSEPISVTDDTPPLVLDVWEHPTVERDENNGRPLRAPNYVVFCDPAEGLAHGDATAVTIYDANNRRCVGRIRTHYPAEEIPEVLAFLGYRYHTALVMIERQSLGWGLIHVLSRYLRYPRIYRMEQIAQVVKGDRTLSLGWSTNVNTKPKMVADYLRAMREHSIFPRDPVFRQEALTFVIDDNGKFGASVGNTDDVVIAHLGAYQGINDIGQYPVVWRDDEVGPITMDELFGIGFPKDEYFLDSPIGQARGKQLVKRSFWIR